MCKQPAKPFAHGRYPTPDVARFLVWNRDTARSRARQPLGRPSRQPPLQCVWQVDGRTGRLQCRWIPGQPSEVDLDIAAIINEETTLNGGSNGADPPGHCIALICDGERMTFRSVDLMPATSIC